MCVCVSAFFRRQNDVQNLFGSPQFLIEDEKNSSFFSSWLLLFLALSSMHSFVHFVCCLLPRIAVRRKCVNTLAVIVRVVMVRQGLALL